VSAAAGPVRAVVVDFDGTVCEHDVSEELLEAFAAPGWWEIDLRFRRGEIGSRECLVRQVELLRHGKEDLLAFVLASFRIDPSFPAFVEWAKARGLEVTVASDGMGFYVEPMLRAGGVVGVAVLTNDLVMNGGPTVSFPQAHPRCVGCGTCKMLAVRTHRERFGRVAFVGEGHSDRYGALYADVVFAKEHLVDICRSDGVAFHPWRTFDDVRLTLDRLTDVPEVAEPERCPGWTVSG
jgi:2-hydroxy-3-keto-5-methylthiopentenyl-1-phosphate phosphatase